MLDFRSDTITKPTKEMLEVMFSAKVGDDVFEEDPTVNELQTYAADYFGKEAAIFCCSGTQTNQIAINVHVQPGGEVICHHESHIYKYEGGGIAKNSGASVRLLEGDRGRLRVETISKWINPDDIHFPITQLVSLEDTANRGGGVVYELEEIQKIGSFCKQNNLPLHLDGARLMNALVFTGNDPKTYAQSFDSISLCLSKGLGAPVGSLLIGSQEFIKKAKRVRKVMGGGMRQAGYMAAAGKYALENHVERLKIDHKHAQLLEQALLQLPWVQTVLSVQTNIVIIVLKQAEKRDEIIHKLAEKNMKIMAFGEGLLRLVTHLDLSESQILKSIEILKNTTV